MTTGAGLIGAVVGGAPGPLLHLAAIRFDGVRRDLRRAALLSLVAAVVLGALCARLAAQPRGLFCCRRCSAWRCWACCSR